MIVKMMRIGYWIEFEVERLEPKVKKEKMRKER